MRNERPATPFSRIRPDKNMHDSLLRSWASRLGPIILIPALALLFFGELVLHPGQVLYSDHSDLVAYHIPVKTFLVQSWQDDGELPLWCPYNYAGIPFIHDIQVGAFYPLHLPLYVLPPERIGAGLSWLIVFHVIAAGWSMYAYARSQGLGGAGAFVAACGYMFAGKWMLHIFAGHYITLGLTWLPLVLLFLERAIRCGSFLSATWAGVAFCLVILGTQPQWTLYAGLLVGLWTFGVVLEVAGFFGEDQSWSWKALGLGLVKWVGFGFWTAVVALALSAVQLLPTAEASPLTTRAAGSAASAQATGFAFLPLLLGPGSPGRQFEFQGNLGLVWLGVALLAPVLFRGKSRFQAAICLLLFFLAITGVIHWIPGFHVFRLPLRLLVLTALPLAILAGSTTQAILSCLGPHPQIVSLFSRPFTLFLLSCLALIVILALSRQLLETRLFFFVYLLTLLITIPWALLLLFVEGWNPRVRTTAWIAMLLVDLGALTWPLVQVRPQEDIYPVSSSVAYLKDHRAEHGRVLVYDRLEENPSSNPLGTGMPLALLYQIEPVRGYNPMDVRRYKEYLQFIMQDQESLQSWENPLTYPIIGDVPVKNKGLVDLLGTQYLLEPAETHQEDPGWSQVRFDRAPWAYDLVKGGLRRLPPYALFANENVFPRAFVVADAVPLPEPNQVMAALLKNDLRKQVFLEDFAASDQRKDSVGTFRAARLEKYRPNAVEVTVEDGPPGFLVLTDVWYPGWKCTVDGQPGKIYRANYLFRAVTIPAGAHRVVFVFAPSSYLWGRRISIGALVAVAALSLLIGWQRVLAHRRLVKEGRSPKNEERR